MKDKMSIYFVHLIKRDVVPYEQFGDGAWLCPTQTLTPVTLKGLVETNEVY